MTTAPTTTPAPMPTQNRLELITWHPAHDRPDADTTVLMSHPADELSEPVWPGYQAGETGQWVSAEGMVIPAPSFWADMPAGTEAGELSSTADNVRRVAQQLVEHCARAGLVITIEQQPLTPLAQGNYATVVTLRPAIQR